MFFQGMFFAARTHGALLLLKKLSLFKLSSMNGCFQSLPLNKSLDTTENKTNMVKKRQMLCVVPNTSNFKMMV